MTIPARLTLPNGVVRESRKSNFMPISLDDLRLKRTTSGKVRRVAPVLIEVSGEYQIAADFCLYFKQLQQSGKRQRDFSEQYLIERAGGDFKLARGLISAMLGFYSWEAETFADYLPADECERLAEMEITNPSSLRLALYDYINSPPRAGFVSSKDRAEAVELFAAGLWLEPDLVEKLLFLDNEENAKLQLRRRKDGELFREPTPAEVVRRYNRLAVEALLFNCSEIVFNFGNVLPGLLTKRIGFQSKELHIPYDMDYNSLGEIQLRLYGPAQAFGSPAKHGERLSKLAFMTLAWARKLPETEITQTEYSGPQTSLSESGKSTPKKRATKAKPAASEVVRSAYALVHLRDKQFLFDFGAFAQHLAPAPTLPEDSEEGETSSKSSNEIREAAASYNFDSSVESRFYNEFAALVREGQTAGWQIEREPEALALPAHNLLFIPDFALQRGDTRIWLEIIGFWTPEYRARKLEKLEKLKKEGKYNLLLAIAQELRADFTIEDANGEKRALPYPAHFYKNYLRPTDVLSLLQRNHDDRASRLAKVSTGRSAIEQLVADNGFVSEDELYRRLKIYNKTELLEALQKLDAKAQYLDSYGLCSEIYLEAARMTLEDVLQVTPRLTPPEACQALEKANLSLDCPRIEALLANLPGIEIARPSLFEVYVQRIGTFTEEPALMANAGKTRRRAR